MNWAVLIWLGLLLVFLIAEAVCAFHLVSIWFAAGALLALFAALAGSAIWLQIAVFLVASCALLALLWPLTRKVLNPGITATNVDSVIGTVGLVTQDIDNLSAQGQVKLGGMYWSARSTSGDPIPAGHKIRVDTIEGVKVFVSFAEETVSV